jgi:starvation-inducible outer membrane lipoprotein
VIRKLAATFLFAVLLSACVAIPYGGTFRFEGPGTEQDFVNAYYACASQTPETLSLSARFNPSVGAMISTSTAPSCSMLRLCLASRGYTQTSTGRFDSRTVAVRCNP